MKFFKISLLALISSISISTMGASIDHIQNYSAEYGANPAQQGAINTGSTVYFNPAGLMRLENGTYLVGGLQYAFGKQKMQENGKDFSTDLSSPIPNFALYKKDDNGAYFWTVGGLGGGAELEYKNSIPLTVNVLGKSIDFNNILKGTNVKGSNIYAQTTFGRAFNLNSKWSASIAIRGVYAKRTLKARTTLPTNVFGVVLKKGSASIDSKRTAYGVGGSFGLNYTPNDRLNIGFRYDTPIKLNFKTSSNIDDNTKGLTSVSNLLLNKYPVYKEGLKTRRDLPAIVALGASYKVNNRWTTFIGGNYYFNEAATMDRIESQNVDYHNGWELSFGSEYWINKKLAWLVGFNYADTGAPDKSFAATEYALNSTMVGTGIKYKLTKSFEYTIAFNHYFYKENTVNNIKYKKEISSIGINLVKRF